MSDKTIPISPTETVDEQEALELVGNADFLLIKLQTELAQLNPRNIEQCKKELLTALTQNEQVAQDCFYALPRGDKTIEGPGIQLALSMAQKWGNLFVKTGILGHNGRTIKAGAVVWDLEKNNTYFFVEERRIFDKNGRTYSEDMIVMTGKAAQSIAMRNSIFKAVPLADFSEVLQQIKDVATGKASGIKLNERIEKAIVYWKASGVSENQMLRTLNKKSKDELNEKDLQTLIGLRTAIKDGHTTLDQAFMADQTQERKEVTKDLKREILGNGK